MYSGPGKPGGMLMLGCVGKLMVIPQLEGGRPMGNETIGKTGEPFQRGVPFEFALPLIFKFECIVEVECPYQLILKPIFL